MEAIIYSWYTGLLYGINASTASFVAVCISLVMLLCAVMRVSFVAVCIFCTVMRGVSSRCKDYESSITYPIGDE